MHFKLVDINYHKKVFDKNRNNTFEKCISLRLEIDNAKINCFHNTFEKYISLCLEIDIAKINRSMFLYVFMLGGGGEGGAGLSQYHASSGVVK